MKNNGEFKYEIVSSKGGYAHRLYRVKKLAGEWPSNEELIRLCGGCIFGGNVTPVGKDMREVKVYTD